MAKNENKVAATGARSIEDLSAELAASLQAQADQDKKVAELNEQISAHRSTIEDLESKNALLNAENATLQAVNDDLTATVEELTKQIESKRTVNDVAKEIAEKKTPPAPTDHFEVNGRKYRFLSPVFVYRKQRIVAADAINNAELLAELVSAGVGSVKAL